MNKRKEGDGPGRGVFKRYAAVFIVFLCCLGILWIYPDRSDAAVESIWKYLLEITMILPAVMIIMGTFTVFISREKVIKYLGATSGLKGVCLAIFFGSLPTGPLYIAFPVAVALRDKGASISNVVIFLSAWACIKMPQELVELHFLGPEFMMSRLVLTIVFVTIMGLLIEKLVADDYIVGAT